MIKEFLLEFVLPWAQGVLCAPPVFISPVHECIIWQSMEFHVCALTQGMREEGLQGRRLPIVKEKLQNYCPHQGVGIDLTSSLRPMQKCWRSGRMAGF